MNLHEHQSKQLFRQFNIPVPHGGAAFNPQQAIALARELGGDRWVVKAQVHAGGRGKAGVVGNRLAIHTPLIDLSKADIIRKGTELGVVGELAPAPHVGGHGQGQVLGHRAQEGAGRPLVGRLHDLGRSMVRTMLEEQGVGLAAPQVHVSKRVVVFHEGAGLVDENDEPITALINPVIEPLGEDMRSVRYVELSARQLAARRAAEELARFQDLPGMHGEVVDGMDALAVWDAVGRAAERAR